MKVNCLDWSSGVPSNLGQWALAWLLLNILMSRTQICTQFKRLTRSYSEFHTCEVECIVAISLTDLPCIDKPVVWMGIPRVGHKNRQSKTHIYSEFIFLVRL